MNDERDIRSTSRRRKTTKKGLLASSDVIKIRAEDDNNVYSYSGTKGIDLLSKSSKAKAKKHRAKLILTNVFLSIVLVLSSLTFAGATLLDYKLIHNDNIDQVEEQGKFDNVVVSTSGNVTYFLVCGLDLSENLTDIMMVVCYDLANNEMSILQIPRDTFVGSEYSTGKINSVYGSAKSGESKIKAVMRCINSKFGLPIDHYITFTIDGSEKVLDAVGGVDITLDRTYKLIDDSGKKDVSKRFGPGNVHFDGQWGVAFVRHRSSYLQGDLGRVKAQRSFYAAFAKKMTTLNFSQITTVITKSFSDISTDLNVNQMLGYAQKAKGLQLNKVNIMSVPGQSGTYNVIGYSQSYYSVHKQDLVNLINKYFMPYEEKVLTVNDLKISELATSYSTGYDEFLTGGSLSEYDTQK